MLCSFRINSVQARGTYDAIGWLSHDLWLSHCHMYFPITPYPASSPVHSQVRNELRDAIPSIFLLSAWFICFLLLIVLFPRLMAWLYILYILTQYSQLAHIRCSATRQIHLAITKNLCAQLGGNSHIRGRSWKYHLLWLKQFFHSLDWMLPWILTVTFAYLT